MTVQLNMIPLLLAFLGIPTAVTALCSWMIQKNIDKREKTREAQDRIRKRSELLLIKGIGASISLGEATAEAVKRLDSNSNGEMQEALAYAKRIKCEQKDFMHEQGVENIY